MGHVICQVPFDMLKLLRMLSTLLQLKKVSSPRLNLELGVLTKTPGLNTDGQPIHLKLKTQPEDPLKTLSRNLETQPQTFTLINAYFEAYNYRFSQFNDLPRALAAQHEFLSYVGSTSGSSLDKFRVNACTLSLSCFIH